MWTETRLKGLIHKNLLKTKSQTEPEGQFLYPVPS
jgi:hypothetical protein